MLPSGLIKMQFIRLASWGGRDSNPRPADYESSILVNAQSRLCLPKRETDRRCRTRLDRVFAMITI
jgi:hypothetical protein